MLVDIISKNGTMLLNILQRPDGTIDEWERWTLEEIGKWFDVCSEGVYGTRPWRVFGEGEARVIIDGFRESEVAWGSSDYRFTAKDNSVYAFMMHAPENRRSIVKSFDENEKSKRSSFSDTERYRSASTTEFSPLPFPKSSRPHTQTALK